MDRTELLAKIMEQKPEQILELCCGTGWIPYGLPLQIGYLGIDVNEGCIELAREKNPSREFGIGDVRTIDHTKGFDLGLAFSCLKHFTLEDLDLVYGSLLRSCKKTLTTVYLRPNDVEELHHPYIHTAITMEHMERVIEENGHKLVQVFTLPPLNTMKEPLVLTEAVDERADLVPGEGLRESVDGRAVHVREGLLGGVPEEAGDPGGEDPDQDEDGHAPPLPGRPPENWPL